MFHAAGLASAMMVVAREMQDPMHHQMGEVMRRSAPGRCGLATDHAERKHDLGGGQRVGQHVGRLVAAAVAGVQATYRAVGGEHDGGAAVARGAGGTSGDRLGARHQTAPSRLRHDHADLSGIPAAAGPLLASGSIATCRIHHPAG